MILTLTRTVRGAAAAALTTGALIAAASAAAAQTVLTITADGETTEFSADDIDALPQAEIRTANEFTDGVNDYMGPLARDVLSTVVSPLVGQGSFIAANDYRIDIPLKDFVDYDVIFATSINGKRLTLRDKGPIWVVYPMTDHPELRDALYNARMIWQLRRIELQ